MSAPESCLKCIGEFSWLPTHLLTANTDIRKAEEPFGTFHLWDSCFGLVAYGAALVFGLSKSFPSCLHYRSYT